MTAPYLGFRRKDRKRAIAPNPERAMWEEVEFLNREAKRISGIRDESDGPIPGSLMWQYNRWW